jgi:biopolymer transport protein ExbD
MADIDVGGDSGHKKGPGVKKAKKLSTRVDMTPMVDLGFLLITFFIFTTTMSTPNTMALNVPKKTEDKDKEIEIKASNALTIMLGKEIKGKSAGLYYYMGQLEADGSNFQSTTYADIRKIIADKRKEVMSRHIHDKDCEEIQKKARDKGVTDWQNACLDKDFVVVIKPNTEAKYGRTIDVLDEMAINDVKAFAVVDITPQENSLIKKTEESIR